MQEIMVLSPKHKTKIPALNDDVFLAYGSKKVITSSYTVFVYIDTLIPAR